MAEPARPRLNKERVLVAAVALADEIGLEALSMRRLAVELGAATMALYKHVDNKDELIDGMIDLLISEIDVTPTGAPWKTAVRSRVLAARSALLSHPWARAAIESRLDPTPTAMGYINSFIGLFLAGGLSVDLTHHAMHAIGGRMWGFTQELYQRDDAAPTPPPSDTEVAMMREYFPNVFAIATYSPHDSNSVVGAGCDDQEEFEFALDLLLDGIERLHIAGR